MSRELPHHSSEVAGTSSLDSPRATLIVAITCASISLIAASLTCWWFAIMKRSFRHHLIMFLIVSDMGKAVWFFIFPLFVFVRGSISSSSTLCQVGGFFLAQATEASDFAALMIALHLVTCVFRPPKRGFQGGLHHFRRWIYVLWALLPILGASLAFANKGNAYTSYGAFCYLPEKPIWYRMVLAWVPRYIVIVTIFTVAFIVTIHVHIRFKRFGHVEDGHLSSEGSILVHGAPHNNVSRLPPESENLQLDNVKPLTHPPWQGSFLLENRNSGHSTFGDDMRVSEASLSESKPRTEAPQALHRGSEVKNIAMKPAAISRSYTFDSDKRSQRTPTSDPRISRMLSVTLPSARTEESVVGFSRAPSSGTDSATEGLITHRHSIERHLRILFLYPTSYLLVWIFPFVSQCFQLSERHFEKQPLWLQILVTGVLALQASVDAAIFSYRERPWKRPKGHALISRETLRRRSLWPAIPRNLDKTARPEEGARQQRVIEQNSASTDRKESPSWWEAEGRKRRDSVWMGTDALTLVKSRQPEDARTSEAMGEEDEDPRSLEMR